MTTPKLTAIEVREFIQDKVEKNRLLDDVEFSDTQIMLAMGIAVDEYNIFIPATAVTIDSFPNKAVLLNGTLAKLFMGQAALLARNHMSYTDGGITIPIEERMQLYQSLAAMYQTAFETMGRTIKLQNNIDSNWSIVPSDYAAFPLF